MRLIYCYDAYCGWCYGFSQVIKKLHTDFKERLPIEILSGGMILPEKPQPISVMAPIILSNYERVEELSGVKFGKDFLWHTRNPELSDWFPNSLKPAIALSVVKEQYPEKAVDFASDMQYALHYEGRDLTDDEAYRHLLLQYGLNENEFYQKLHQEEYEELARYDFSLVKQLQVDSYPTLLLQATESKFYLVAKGYTSYELVTERLMSILKEI